ncbi:MAG: FlgD immunoglobulin-like domain containing protein, partial [bacterium]
IFTVKVTNVGTDPATDVEIIEQVPSEFTVVRALTSAGTYIGGTWRLGTLPVGSPDSLTIRAIVNVPGVIRNIATAAYSEPPDPFEADNADTVYVDGQQADLRISKTPSVWEPGLGEEVTFTVQVTNDGPNDATGVVVFDPLPDGLTLTDSVHDPRTTFNDSTWTIGDLYADQTLTLQLQCIVVAEGAIMNRARISASNLYDPDPNNNVSSVTLSAEDADLELRKVASDTAPDIGDTVTFTVILRNLGPSEALGIQVLDQVPQGLTYVSSDPGTGTYTPGTGVWSIGSLTVGVSDTLRLSATIDQPVQITNTATLIASATKDENAGNNSASEVVTGEASDLDVTATISSTSNPRPIVGEDVTFIIEVVNHGPSNADNVVLTCPIPAGLAWLSDNGGGGYDHSTGIWNIAGLTAGGSTTLTIDTDVVVAASTTLEAISSADQPDPRSDNDSDRVTLYQESADLALTKEAGELFPILNTEFTYTITVTNNGPDDLATGIVVEDLLPPELTFVSASADSGLYIAGIGVWDLGSLSEGTSATLVITVIGDTEATVLNSAAITAMDQFDDNEYDNSDAATVHVTDPPPSIVPGLVAALTPEEPVTITATITDNRSVTSATLHYRSGMIASYSDVSMTNTTGDTYEGTIPGGWVTANGLFCYISAMDDADHEGYSDHLPLSVSVANVVKGSAQPGGSEVSAYQIIGAPLNLDNQSIRAVLEDDLGAWAPSKWRIYSLNADELWVEHENGNGSMPPTRGFMLIVKEQGKYLDSGPGQSVPMNEPYAVNLHEGWNMVANPFNIPIDIANLSFATHPDSLGEGYLQRYQAAWSIWSAGALNPWDGFIVYTNDANEQLLMDPGLPVEKSAPLKTPPSLWAVHVEAQVQHAVDRNNSIVILPEASAEWDFYDYPEPPVIGDYVSVSFPHPEWNEPAHCFQQDARPTIDEGDIWDLEVRTNVQDMVHLSFSGIESVPDDYQIWLHDELLEMNINLRESAKYSFVGTSEQYARHLKLVIGNENYIQTEMPTGELMPQRVELSQNFPNPFNPLTTIKFGLPHAAEVSLDVYDVRGRLVHKLLDNKLLPAGRHAEVWDGTDRANRRVASGVYLYRLQVGDAIKTQKMVLMK